MGTGNRHPRFYFFYVVFFPKKARASNLASKVRKASLFRVPIKRIDWLHVEKTQEQVDIGGSVSPGTVGSVFAAIALAISPIVSCWLFIELFLWLFISWPQWGLDSTGIERDINFPIWLKANGITYSSLSMMESYQDFIMFLRGKVTANWNPPTLSSQSS
ncbi:MAG TPA: hypothetical protein VKM55_12240 [Candidatus Lokiarchaeia archaeon]|nr:hypothetical protein [Candidatus Lokiarchaeia archaeon]